jgi:hypothetical protein
MTHNKNDLYLAKNAGKVRRYQITRAKAKHFREESENGEIRLVCYGATDSNNPNIRNVILLTPEDAATKYAHMGLLALERERVDMDAPKRGRPPNADKSVDEGKA